VEPLLVFPDPPPAELSQALDLGGYPWKAVSSAEVAAESEPDDGWAGAIVCADERAEQAFALCRTLRKRDMPLEPLLLLVRGEQLGDLSLRDELYDDFSLTPVRPPELEARLRHLFWRTGARQPARARRVRPARAQPGDLPGGDQRPAARPHVHGVRALKFLSSHPGKVFTRETLLSRVWGYDYYGGARTVDVHVRRLRAKLSEEHAPLIQTVRSVGYRFGETRWSI
jgi:DNA-binding response OmpR family regulator